MRKEMHLSSPIAPTFIEKDSISNEILNFQKYCGIKGSERKHYKASVLRTHK